MEAALLIVCDDEQRILPLVGRAFGQCRVDALNERLRGSDVRRPDSQFPGGTLSDPVRFRP
jgi:hypothetical protein